MRSYGFPPASTPKVGVLVLGSLPGKLSLERGEYYANPQNAFWRIVATGIGDLPADYAGRIAALTARGIGLWDVLAAASRRGSSDAAIEGDAIPNNFRAFFNAHPHVRLICFNGATAARIYERRVIPTLTASAGAIPRQTLPSTSGAHASLSFANKAARWSRIWTADPRQLQYDRSTVRR